MRVIQIEDYRWWVNDHLLNAANFAIHPKLVALFEYTKILLDKVKMKLSVQEENL